eukprot:TRINITY_DN25624_c0_g1_i1.p1 TRINITY_DN25624_c0_g1~~TRINITY_DN25624_c0_g1_i1.p1  ORF type:complete len:210 (+),score=33.35 TRINITY_DN25624_c0_g1_i1:483-1112(+)
MCDAAAEAAVAAAKAGDEAPVLAYLSGGGSPNVSDDYSSLLGHLCKNSLCSAAQAVIAMPNADVNSGEPLFHALHAHLAAPTPETRQVCVSLLARGDIDVNQGSGTSRGPPLHKIARGSVERADTALDLLELLLAHPGVDVNATNDEGLTALHRAAMWGHTAIVARLLRHEGIRTAAVDHKGRSASDRARAMGFAELAALITGHGGCGI